MTYCAHPHVMKADQFPEAIGVARLGEKEHLDHPCCGDHDRCTLQSRSDASTTFVDVSDLVGSSDVARIFNVRTTAVNNWRQRYNDFPEPVAQLNENNTLVFSRKAVMDWARSTGRA